MVDLAPQLMYMCVPSKNTSTFLTSSAVNTSQFPFLPGDTAVYLNGSFVAKTHMKNVSPGERFSCSLGIDTALRVDYKPARKYHEQIGLINKSSSTIHEQVIVIKNSRADSVLITIKEQIPRSTDEKIKIKLVSPAAVQNGEATNGADEAQLPKEGACMKASILEWTVAVPGGESKELHVKWALEHPSNEKVEMIDHGSPVVHKKECRDQTLEKVVVYNDRAELKRKVQLELQPGINDLHIENVTTHIIHDSVRVDGRGHGTIHDVQLIVNAATYEETDSPKVTEVRAKLDAKQREVDELNDRVSILQRKIEVLDKVVEKAGDCVVSPPKESSETFNLNKETLTNLTNFYNFYDESSTSVRSDQRQVKIQLEKAKRELDVLQQQLNRALADEMPQRLVKTIIVTLDSEKGGLVELEVSYQVHGASWRPSYDLRVDTTGEHVLKISYFGNISQNTKEDWMNATLVLSTAQPCLGGNLPELGVLEAVFYRPPPVQPQQYMLQDMSCRNGLFGAPAAGCAFGAAPPMMKQAVAYVAAPAENSLSAEFTISKPSAIPSDGAEHKVTIGVVDLTPQLIHECVPSKNTSAFLTATAINSSALSFLSGASSVYLNNSFVAKTTMKNVSPGERFSCCLGVDAALRVEYKPVKKYHEQVGYINKTSSVVHEQLICVKNTRAEPVLLTLKEQIPRSTDEKIKIKLVAPVVPQNEEAQNGGEGDSNSALESPKEGARLKDGILLWTVAVKGGNSADLLVKWNIEHPKEEKIEFIERH
ncbi:hypothetical protein Q1695_006405 [Nippostrongylus brasiliensis]|nr:hypothetical protein Q1695_006405 [Nippostrongylus brasiliensis]